MRARRTPWLWSAGLIVFTAGCAEAPESVQETSSAGVASANGLAAINGLNAHNGLDTINGLNIHNGLAAVNGLNAHNGLTAVNGLNAHNGLAAINGLNAHNGFLPSHPLSGDVQQHSAAAWTTPGPSAPTGAPAPGVTSAAGATNDLMTSADGRTTMSYLVRCALPAGHSITMTDQTGMPYTFAGEIGIAPQWENGACDTACQEYVTACLLAHVNTTGQHIALWLVSTSPAVGWGQDPSYPYQEGTFFGNIFESPPKAYYCDGKDHAFGVVPGRLGANQTNSPYTNPLGQDVLCQSRCTAAGGTNNNDGFSSCPGIATEKFTHLVTVYRNFDPTTPYKICNRANSLCLDVAQPGQTAGDGAPILQEKYNTTYLGQKWQVTMPSPGKYEILNIVTGLALTATGSSAALHPYGGTASQLWTFKSMADGTGYDQILPSSSTTASISAANYGSATPGLAVELDAWQYSDSQKWVLSIAN